MAAVAVLAAVAVVLAVRLLFGAIRLSRTDGGETIRDPQFAEPAESVTRPPELAGEGFGGELSEDPSDGWDMGVQTPVDKTAGELSAEAAAGE